jgi:hypothetical protein
MGRESITKPLLNHRGIGDVVDKGRLISRVSYDLDLVQEEFWADTSDQLAASEFLEFTAGTITIMEKGKRLTGINFLTLLLQDHRRLDFEWKKIDSASPRYIVRGCGSFH